MARKRDYAAEYAARQQRARERGFGSYYERRVAGVAKGQRARVRGHAGKGQLRSFMRFIRNGDRILCPIGQVEFAAGSYKLIVKEVLLSEVRSRSDRRKDDRVFYLRNLTRAELVDLIDFEHRVGVIFSPNPSMDQQRLISNNEGTGGY